MINLKSQNIKKVEFLTCFLEHEHCLKKIKDQLLNHSIIGNEFTGWLDYYQSLDYTKSIQTIEQIKTLWKTLNIDTVVVIGIGGSSIGTKAVINMIANQFNTKEIEIIFVESISTKYDVNLINYLKNKNWAMTVISKSAKTFETAINFRIFIELLKNHFNDNWNQRLTIITEDDQKNNLNQIAKKYNTNFLIIPTNIGGRFSTITPVGLFIFRLLDFNIDELMQGYNNYITSFKSNQLIKEPSINYALMRYFLKNKKDKDVEVFCSYEQNLNEFGQYYKQIFAETEGKTKNVLIPTIAHYSNDLHAIGQLYQQGPKNFFETILMYNEINYHLNIPQSSIENNDGLETLINDDLFNLNYSLMQSVIEAHNQTPSIIIALDKNDLNHAGQLLAFLQLSAVFSARLNDLNPFDQPGVEAYKNNLKTKLGAK